MSGNLRIVYGKTQSFPYCGCNHALADIDSTRRRYGAGSSHRPAGAPMQQLLVALWLLALLPSSWRNGNTTMHD